MSGSKWQAEVPNELDGAIIEYKRKNGIESNSEATRQLLRKGVERYNSDQSRSTIIQAFHKIGEIAFIAAAVGILMTIGLSDARVFTATVAFIAIAISSYSIIGLFQVRGD